MKQFDYLGVTEFQMSDSMGAETSEMSIQKADIFDMKNDSKCMKI